MAGGAWQNNFSDGYQFGDVLASLFGIKKNTSPDFSTGSYFQNDTAASTIWEDITGQSNTKYQNSAAASLQEDAQAWQKEYAQNAHQWEVQDLKNAGLNPWLSANGGVSSASAGIANAQASNVNPLASVGTAAAGIGILIKAVKAAMK